MLRHAKRAVSRPTGTSQNNWFMLQPKALLLFKKKTGLGSFWFPSESKVSMSSADPVPYSTPIPKAYQPLTRIKKGGPVPGRHCKASVATSSFVIIVGITLKYSCSRKSRRETRVCHALNHDTLKRSYPVSPGFHQDF